MPYWRDSLLVQFAINPQTLNIYKKITFSFYLGKKWEDNDHGCIDPVANCLPYFSRAVHTNKLLAIWIAIQKSIFFHPFTHWM